MKLEKKILNIIKKTTENKQDINLKTNLIGNKAVIDSSGLVQVCISLEELSNELGFEFDWTSEKAMSNTLSMFRTAGSVIKEFKKQQKK